MTASVRTYSVVHETEYTYPDEVAASYGRAHLTPRQLPEQDRLEQALVVLPAPAEQQTTEDYFGNDSTYFHVTEPHRQLLVTGSSVVRVHRDPTPVESLATQPWEQVRDTVPRLDVTTLEMALESPSATTDAAVRAYARRSLRPGRPYGEAVRELITRIHSDFHYESGSTTVATTVAEVFATRTGVCQDFAHVAIAALRSLRLPARYVSGYLETEPPPGRARLQGVDASHAWLSVPIPGHGWVDLDPTNDQQVDDRYVTLAWGRDYGDVPPVKGVIFTDAAEHTMAVRVDVTPVDR